MKSLDSVTGAVVRETLCDLLPVYPSQEFAVSTLHTLTLLSSHCLVDVPDQVELLLSHLTSDPRRSVKKQVLPLIPPFYSVCYFLGKEIIDLPGGQISDPLSGRRLLFYSSQLLPVSFSDP